MAVVYKNNCLTVKREMSRLLRAALMEIGGEIKAQVDDNIRHKTGETAGSFDGVVEETTDGVRLTVGSSLPNAIYEEFGTGEYALNGKGRSTPWVYQDAQGQFHRTKGKRPTRALFKAFSSVAPKAEKHLKDTMEGL